MADVVLLHGAMHGGWCWSRLLPYLRAGGHEVVAPTLTGMGERRHLLSPDVGLATHVADVVNILEFEALDSVTLVPHSYAGVVADAVAEVSERVARIVRLDAFVVEDGESLMDVEPGETQAFYRRWANERGEGWRLVPDTAFLDQWGVTEPADVAFVAPWLTDFPLRCLTDVAFLPTRRGQALTVGAIWHTSPALGGLASSRARVSTLGCPTIEVRAGHDAMVSHPGEVAAALEAAGLG
jgi:pimeloyl-ACP methyl ester carboxylesterase